MLLLFVVCCYCLNHYMIMYWYCQKKRQKKMIARVQRTSDNNKTRAIKSNNIREIVDPQYIV
tara:strand:+ start:2830 stop:3015 length:186 start_codon:yes stop_codon:yes gene_type:complete